MNKAGNITRLISLAIVFGILATVAFVVIDKANRSRMELPILNEVAQFEFVERSGEPFGKDQLLGKISVVDFFFTRCVGPCPVMAVQMNRLYEIFSDFDQVQLVSITVDPDVDSLPVLKQYARDLEINDHRWLFVRGEYEVLKPLSEKSFMLAADDLPGGHSTKFVLVDQLGMIRGYYSGTEPESIDLLIMHIKLLAKLKT